MPQNWNNSTTYATNLCFRRLIPSASSLQLVYCSHSFLLRLYQHRCDHFHPNPKLAGDHGTRPPKCQELDVLGWDGSAVDPCNEPVFSSSPAQRFVALAMTARQGFRPNCADVGLRSVKFGGGKVTWLPMHL